ncbi:MAG: apolipoprotein N-acyltransferase [Rhodospirillales bacterium]|nr:apolipoprotein N-acyltransferase [Rhodospirillales bacterium]
MAQGIGVLAGWRRALAAVALGAAATGALPPVYLWPLAAVAFTGLVWLVDGASGPRRAFAAGWWFGFGHFVTGLYWIAHALLTDAEKFAWMIPFAVFGLSAVFAIYCGLATLVLKLSRARGIAGVLVLAVAWTGGEWLRGHLLSGFPWNLIGSIWVDYPPMMQAAALFGAYGLSLATVALAAMPATLAGAAGRLPTRWAGVGVAAAVLVLGWGFGQLRLSMAADDFVPGIRLRLVQPNVPQNIKWDPAMREEHFRKTLALSREPGFEGRTHIIWPETATPFTIDDNAQRRLALAAVTPPGGLLITGAPRIERDADGRFRGIWNSLHAVDGSGAIVGTYDKFHLVPFGEYVPLRSILGFAKVTPGAIDFSAGHGPATLDLPGLPKVSPLICYEIIFPARVVDPTDRPGWIVNLTNDAWFGISSGPYQHFAAARLRAVEEGLPVVRAANNGISAVVDPYGRVIGRLGLGRTGVVDADLPRAIDPPFYARWGDAPLAALAGIFLGLAALLRRRD